MLNDLNPINGKNKQVHGSFLLEQCYRVRIKTDENITIAILTNQIKVNQYRGMTIQGAILRDFYRLVVKIAILVPLIFNQ